AARALAAWPDDAACPALFRLAASSQSVKCRKLAQIGLQKKITDENKSRLIGAWRQARAQMPDAEARKAIDGLFGNEINVARGKPVTANVRHEGNRVTANLTDGTHEPWFGHGLPAVATVDLGEVLPVHAAKILFWYSDPRTYTFRLEISEDGKAWRQVGGNEADPKPATAEGVRLAFAETPARFVRLTVLGNTANPNAHVHELEVYQRLF
ncbi:MAG: discoidin domain-containing protein, partial [Kiritimatiellae bacterium]|nr:discoidin domain-containing protein [Kiritimatiellia bacterium]